MESNQTLKKNPTFLRTLDVTDHVESISKSKDFKKYSEAQNKMTQAIALIQDAIEIVYEISPEASQKLKDEILRG